MPTPRVTIDALPAKAIPDADDKVVLQDSGVTKHTTVGGLLTSATDGITSHVADPSDAHDATAISALNSGNGIDGVTVQAQLAQISTALAALTAGGGGGGGGPILGNVWYRWTGTQAEYDALGTYRADTLYSISDVVSPEVPLSEPRNVTALAGDASVTISWLAPAGGTPSYYDVQRSTVPDAGFVTINLSPIPAGTNTFLNTPLTNNTTYYYRVVAHDAGGASVTSTVVAATPHATAPTVPGVPTNVVAIAGPSAVTINWLAPVSNGNSPITGYTIETAPAAGGPFTLVTSVSATTFTYLHSGRTNGTTYYYRVFATNAIGNSAYSSTVSAVPTTGATVPSAPTSVVATAGVLEVTVTWGPPSSTGGSTLNAYVIERSTLSSSGFVTVGTVTATSPHSFASSGLTAGTTYYFRVTVQNGIGTSPASSIVNAVPTAGGAVPSDWATAIATNNLTTITSWYDTYTGHLSESWDPAGLWGPGQTSGITINDAWLTANAAAGKVVLSAGRWTITGLHCSYIDMRKTNVTLSHCFIDRSPTVSAWGVDASPSGVGAFKGTIVDHCTLAGNFGTGADGDFGDAIQYYNPTDHAVDSFIIRYCDISGYRAGLYCAFGATCEYNWVHDLYIYADSHNTAGSIRGENTRIYRNLLTDGTSSAVSLYADNTPYTAFEVNENIMTTTNADYSVQFPVRAPDYWNLLYGNPTLVPGQVDGAPLTSTFGYRRELNGNVMIPGLVGLASDASYFTSTRGNRLLDGTPTLFDEGGAAVANQPRLLKMRYNELGGGGLDRQQTWEFTPSPNSTILVFVGCVNAGHSTTIAPVVTSVGQYPQTSFAKILESPFTFQTGDENHGLQLSLFKAETGATTSFEHIAVDPYATTQNAYFTIWVYELTGMTGLSLAHSSVKGQAAVGFGATLSTITSNALSGAATTGRVCMAFAAGGAVAAPGGPAYADVAGWTKTGVQKTTFSASNPFCTGAVYWSKTFTGTTITIPGLGTGTYEAGVLLAEFA